MCMSHVERYMNLIHKMDKFGWAKPFKYRFRSCDAKGHGNREKVRKISIYCFGTTKHGDWYSALNAIWVVGYEGI